MSLTVADWAGGAASAEVCEAIIHFLLWLGTSCGHKAAAKVCGAGAVALICQIEPSNPGKSWCLWLILKYIKVSIAAISEHRDCS